MSKTEATKTVAKMRALAKQATAVWTTEGKSARWEALEAELLVLWTRMYGA